jgi:hypothetical protein
MNNWIIFFLLTLTTQLIVKNEWQKKSGRSKKTTNLENKMDFKSKKQSSKNEEKQIDHKTKIVMEGALMGGQDRGRTREATEAWLRRPRHSHVVGRPTAEARRPRNEELGRPAKPPKSKRRRVYYRAPRLLLYGKTKIY